ncbi:hypothetical protein DITRI_Ditri09bG0055300 [Diplodiscus trichospermus]
MDAFANKVDREGPIHLVSIPDGMGLEEDRNQLGKLTDGISQVMPVKLKEFIKKINRLKDDKITCVIADVNMGWALQVAAELGIPAAAFWPASALLMALLFNTQKLIDKQVIVENGTPINKEKMIQLYPITPAIHPENVLWPPGSVLYVAFGSFSVFDPIQFQELALGLELSNRPFLWVVIPDITEVTESDYLYPKGFKERVGTRGRMVGWAPQRVVLAHPSIACFLSNCGWNSTIEGKDERGIITREEIRSKVERLLGDESFKKRSLKLKESVMNSVNGNETIRVPHQWTR